MGFEHPFNLGPGPRRHRAPSLEAVRVREPTRVEPAASPNVDARSSCTPSLHPTLSSYAQALAC